VSLGGRPCEREPDKRRKLEPVKPLDAVERVNNYMRQNGTDKLTPKQQRRVLQKARRSGD
jgi:hypothetical protein